MSADKPIAEKRSQTTAHLKGECSPKLLNKEAGQLGTHSKQTQHYKRSNFRMRTRWNKIFYIYHTCSVFVDLLSKQMLAWYKRTYMGTPFQQRRFPFRGEIKQPSIILLNICLSTVAKTLALHHIFKIASLLSHSSRAAAHLGIASLEIQNKLLNIWSFFNTLPRFAIPKWQAAHEECDNTVSFLEYFSSSTKSVETFYEIDTDTYLGYNN